MATFTSSYQALNTAQKQAVDAIEGPVMVIAGPGTGKTQILTLRIANILKKTDTPPSAILALTFTEAGVYAMRKRLVELIGPAGYAVSIFTFHGFCNDMIRRYPDAYPRIIGSAPITDVDTYRLIEFCLAELPLTHLRPYGDPRYYVKSITSAIGELKRENCSPQEARERNLCEREAFESIEDLHHEKGVHKGKMKGKYATLEKQLQKNEELVLVYERYEQLLRERALYDYEDMIVETVTALSTNEEFLLTVQEEYLYILADEHQDANNSQNTLLELLASFHENPNLFLVGDAKQAIYRFQGASLENFLYFKKQYPNALLIQLEDNYRSRQSILDSSYSLIAKGDLSEHERKAPLKAHLEGKDEKICIAEFSESAFEYAYIASSIHTLLEEGVPPEEIAVLYRNNSDVDALVPALERAGVPYVIESDQDALADEVIHGLITLLTAVARYGNDEALARALYVEFLGFPPLDLYKLARVRTKHHSTFHELIVSASLLAEAGVSDSKRILTFSEQYARFATRAKNYGLLTVLDEIMHESGFMAHVLTLPDGREKLELVRAFVRDAETLVESHREYRLLDVIAHVELLATYNLSITVGRAHTPHARVRLMTAHKSKGLEFDHVVLMNAYDGKWGNKKSRTHFTLLRGTSTPEDERADERRLFYVALTRARHGVTITYARENISGRPQLPSQFIEEIDEAYRAPLNTQAFEETVSPEQLLARRSVHHAPALERAYLQEIFLEQGLSATAFNNYLHDPWEYVFTNLLRLPKAPNKHMLYGNAVHGALRDLFERLKEGAPVDLEYLLGRFQYHLSRMAFSDVEYTEAKKKGMEALTLYWTARASSAIAPFATEYKLASHISFGDGLRIPVRGILDRVTLLPDGSVEVVDYKTGKPKSRNEIEGNTKAEGAGDYKRQLVLYALLLSEQEGALTPGALSCAAIDFVEPDARGKIRPPEVFFITEEDIADLKNELTRVASEIYSLSFWKQEPSEKSVYRALVDRVRGQLE